MLNHLSPVSISFDRLLGRDSRLLDGALALILFGFLTFPLTDTVRAQTVQSYDIHSDSRIWVEGTSSVHDWSCEVESFSGSISAAGGAQQPFSGVRGGSLTIPVDAMECGKSKMNSKLRDAFQMKRHPEITFEGQNVESGSGNTLTVTGDLTMAGTTRTIDVTVTGSSTSNGRLQFTGQHSLDMTDYGMDPPTALLGTIRTGERVVVNFELLTQQ